MVEADSDEASRAVLVFIRAPEAGRVKTRLAAEIGDVAALGVYRRLAEHAVQAALALGPLVSVRVHFTPANAGDAVRAWLGAGPVYLPQADDADLGVRMRAAFEAAFGDGFDRVVVIGSDLPDLTAEILRGAFERLESTDAVVGPARDGGYWLLGLKRMLPGVFDGIAWSTGEVLARTLERLRSMQMEPALLEELADVDEAGDLPPGWREWAASGEETTDREARR